MFGGRIALRGAAVRPYSKFTRDKDYRNTAIAHACERARVRHGMRSQVAGFQIDLVPLIVRRCHVNSVEKLNYKIQLKPIS